MTSDVRQRIRRAMPMSANGQRQFQDQTGIDIESDIDRVVACLEPRAGGRTAGLVLARGRFNETQIEALMRQHGAEVDNYSGKRVIAHPSAPSQGEGIALSFLEPGLAAFGSGEMVRSAIDLLKSGDDVTKNVELMAVLRSIDHSHAWVVGRFEALRADGRLPAEVASRLPPITWFSASGRVDSNISGIVRVDTRDEEAANNLRDVVRGFLALAKLQAGSRPGLQTMMQSLELGGRGNSTALSFSIPGDVFDILGDVPHGTPQGPAAH
jgi:hypothetical protein